MKRFYADIRAMQSALQETPEVLHCVSVDVAMHVLHSMIYNFMLEVFRQTIVGMQFVTENGRACFNVLADFLLKDRLASTEQMHHTYIAATFDHSERHLFAAHAVGTAAQFFKSLRLMHVAGFPADECLIDFNAAA